jgi:hypothetical protein
MIRIELKCQSRKQLVCLVLVHSESKLNDFIIMELELKVRPKFTILATARYRVLQE